ncbi:hypothetical protein AB0B89_35035 [Sphaerisporangium sp. NPDC049002]|uniref:hypothetical protein n=1 Tax=unclassified Sphaerisporangium TaxID=2630420 RepID=UPI0033F6A805
MTRFVRRCPACAAMGRRDVQLVWEVAHSEAEQVITLDLVRGLLDGFPGSPSPPDGRTTDPVERAARRRRRRADPPGGAAQDATSHGIRRVSP